VQFTVICFAIDIIYETLVRDAVFYVEYQVDIRVLISSIEMKNNVK